MIYEKQNPLQNQRVPVFPLKPRHTTMKHRPHYLRHQTAMNRGEFRAPRLGLEEVEMDGMRGGEDGEGKLISLACLRLGAVCVLCGFLKWTWVRCELPLSPHLTLSFSVCFSGTEMRAT